MIDYLNSSTTLSAFVIPFLNVFRVPINFKLYLKRLIDISILVFYNIKKENP